MANHLGMDPVHYQKEYDEFMVKLKKFHNSKGTPFKRPPWLGGQYLDIFLLYKKVVSFGGWVKVTEDKRWKDVAECFNLPATCTNAAFALRQHYSRYLEAFERINFFGEDAEDVLVSQNARPHTPVSVGLLSGTSDYTSVISNKDPAKNFEKLILSLECGLPNEVDFAINVCMLLSNVSNSVFNLTKAPAVVEMLLAHTGVFCEESHSLKEVHKEWYQNSQRDFIKFWKETIQLKEMREYLCEPQDMNPENGDCDDENEEVLLFHPKKKIVSSRDVEAQRVFQVCMILHNFSFDVTNASVLATHPVCQRFLVMCVCSRLGCLQKIAWQTLSNLAEKMVLEAIESESTQMFFQMLHIYLVDKDRFHVLSAMDVLGKVCLLEYNDEVIESGLEVAAYEALVKVLMVPDIKLLIGSLETLYNLTGVGQVTSNYVSNVVHSIDILVCLVTLEVESFGSDVLAKVRLIENKAPVPKAVIAKPQPNQSSTLQGVPAPTPQTPTTSSANSRNEVDADTFTQNWISAFYEVNPSCSVSRIDLYADYLSCCSKLARVGILNATAFNRILKSVFPSAQLRRVQSSSQLQYAIQGICRRSNPLPVKSKLDLPDTTSTPSQQIHGSALQRGFSSSQNISVPNRTPTPPTPSQQQTWSQSGQAQNQTRPIVANLSMAHTHVVQRPASPVTVTKTYQRPSTSPALQQGQRPGFPGQATQRLQNVWKAQQSNQLQGLDLRQAQTLQTQVQPKRLAQSPHSGSLQQPVQGGNLQPQKVISQTTCNAGNLQRPTAAEQTALQRQQPQQQQQTFRQQQEQLYRQRQQQLQQMRQQMHSENQAAMLRRSSHGQTPPPVLPAQTSPRPQQVSNQAQSNRPVQPGIQQQLHGVQHVSHQTNQFVVQQAQLSIRASNGLSHSSLMPQINTPNATATSTYRAPLVSGASNKVSQSPARTQASQQSPVVMPIHSQLPSNQKQFSPIARKPDFGQESQMQTSLGIPVNSQIQPQVRTNVQVTQAQRLLLPSPQGLTTPGQAQSREQSTMQGSLQLSVGGVPTVQQVIRVNSRQSKAQPTQNFVSCSNTPKTNSAVSGDGVVLVAREERAEDVVTSELMKEAKEARIVMVENVRLAGSEPGMIKARLESNDLKPELHEISRPVGNAVNNSVSSGGLNGPAHCKEQHRGIDVPNFDSSVSVDNSNKISKNSRPTSLDTNSVGLGEVVDNITKKEKHSNNEPYVPSPTKKPRLDTKLPSLDSDILDSPTEIRRSDSPSSLVNGDIRLDSKNRFMDKLLGKDLHLPLNGVCGIDASDLDVGISSEEDPLSSRKSSPDIFDSCNNSDFDQFLEDNALFGDVLTGDLRVDSDSSAAKTDISLEQSNSQSMQENGLRNSTSVSENTRTVNPFMDCTKSAGLPVQNSVTSDKGRIASSSENRTIAPNYKEILTNSRFDIPQQIPVNQVQRVPNTVSSNPAMYNQLNGDNVRNTPTFNSIQEPSSRVIAANAPPYFDNRTKGVATPGALVSEPSMQHGQQQSTPPSPMSPVVKSGIVASDGTSPKLTPFTSTVPSPVTETSKPYRCHWDVCLSSFDSSKQLLSHMVSEHVPVNSLLMACQWQGCTPVRRSRSSLIFHLQQKHLDPSSQSAAGTASSPALPRPKPAISQEPVQAQQAFIPQTFQFMARMLQALQADEESPLTKTVRLTAALVLRNVAQYSAVARSLLRRHERSLVQVAMSNSEASQAAAACLAELSPHRKSPEREATFSWALDS